MFRNISALARPVTRAALNNQLQPVRCMGGHGFKPDSVVAQEHQSSLNFMPVPQGSWQEAHSKRQSRYNMYLGASAILLVITGVAANAAGVFLWHEIKDVTKVDIKLD